MARRHPGAGAAAVFAALAALTSPLPARAALDVQTVVRRVQARYDATRDFSADVTEENTIASLGKTTTAHGTVTFKKPGKMRWDLDGSDPQVIVGDGTTLWLYQPQEHQVLKAPFDAAFRSSTPISFLTGVGRIAQDFEARLEGTAAGSPLVLVLTPKRDAQAIGQLRLTVARDTFDIVGAETRDPLGNVTRLRFDHIRRNTGVPDGRFVFQVPSGVDVVPAPALQ